MAELTATVIWRVGGGGGGGGEINQPRRARSSDSSCRKRGLFDLILIFLYTNFLSGISIRCETTRLAFRFFGVILIVYIAHKLTTNMSQLRYTDEAEEIVSR